MPNEKVEETETGYRLTIKSTRGTGTRDQDKVSVTAKTETLGELLNEAPELREVIVREMNFQRANQPDNE